MAKSVFYKIDSEYLKRNYLNELPVSMAKKFGVSTNSIHRYLKKLGLVLPIELIDKRKTDPLRGRTTYNEKEDHFIKDNLNKISNTEIGFELGRTTSSIKKRALQLGLEYLPAVTGTRKNFNIEKVWPEIIRIRKSKYGQSKFIKIKNGHWKLYHVYLWEIHFGVITKDFYLAFIDGDNLNCILENLKLMPKNNVLNSDRKIATDMSRKNKSLRDELLKHPKLIELKRQQQNLNKAINDAKTC